MTQTIKIFAAIDFVLGIVLATPWLGTEIVQIMHKIVSTAPLTIDSYHAFLMKILGVMVILWAMIRWQHTAAWQISYDCIARLFVLSFMGYYCYNGLTVLVFFIAVELLGLYQWFVKEG